MRPSGDIYESPRLAEGYVSCRPPLHPLIVGRLAARLGVRQALARALDVGCGVGLSTAPLAVLSPSIVGLDPSLAMLRSGRRVVRGTPLVAGRAEALPFKAGSFELVTAAGAINYSDAERFLSEVGRVLAPGGWLAIYDFGSGRRFQQGSGLESWFDSFEALYPFPPGYALDVTALPFASFGLKLVAFDDFELVVPMTLASYVACAMTETNVEQAISENQPESEIRAWCLQTLAPLFGSESRPVVFPAYLACVEADFK